MGFRPPLARAMARKKATFEKVQREHQKERKRIEKLEKRLQRKDDKKAAAEEGPRRKSEDDEAQDGRVTD